VFTVTGCVLIDTAAQVLPAAILAVFEMSAATAGLLEEIWTMAPLAGAAAPRYTYAVVTAPPLTGEGVQTL
jgi:hypothetical protein